MAYKLLGFVVWQGAKWWARRKLSSGSTRLAIAGLAIAVVAGAIAAGKQTSGSD